MVLASKLGSSITDCMHICVLVWQVQQRRILSPLGFTCFLRFFIVIISSSGYLQKCKVQSKTGIFYNCSNISRCKIGVQAVSLSIVPNWFTFVFMLDRDLINIFLVSYLNNTWCWIFFKIRKSKHLVFKNGSFTSMAMPFSDWRLNNLFCSVHFISVEQGRLPKLFTDPMPVGPVLNSSAQDAFVIRQTSLYKMLVMFGAKCCYNPSCLGMYS